MKYRTAPWRALIRNNGFVRTWRLSFEAVFLPFPKPETLQCQPVSVAGLPAEWITTVKDSTEETILFLHGGGYTAGSLRSHRKFAGWLAHAVAARCLMIDYRLAPEHPFPAALEDAVSAYRWLLSKGTSPGRMAIAGDSAGGGLALSTLFRLRDAGDPLPAVAYLMSPWVDLLDNGKSIQSERRAKPGFEDEVLQYFADLYTAGHDPGDPLVSPLYGIFEELPPLIIQAGKEEHLWKDARLLAEGAKKAGNDVWFEPYEGGIHVKASFSPISREGTRLLNNAAEVIKKHIAG